MPLYRSRDRRIFVADREHHRMQVFDEHGKFHRGVRSGPSAADATDGKAGPGSGSIVLLLVPAGTVLPVIRRQGEWIEVTLSPELRKVGSPMRWYRNEGTGVVHESTVETFKKESWHTAPPFTYPDELDGEVDVLPYGRSSPAATVHL
jgi:hypothetical protein